jgi:hypothetical protein
MMLLRGRQLELDKWRDPSYRFCHSWIMFFRTMPPGIHPNAVFFTERERTALTTGVSSFANGDIGVEVEPYDEHVQHIPGLGRVHGSGKNPALNKFRQIADEVKT